jgi:hypothetical protein
MMEEFAHESMDACSSSQAVLSSSCAHLLQQIFRESFRLKTSTTTKNPKMESMASPAHCTGCFGYKTLLTWHRKMGFWPAPFYTGCESLANATTQSNTYS